MGTGGCDDRQGDGLFFHQPGWAPSPAPERCRRKTNVSISPEEFGCPGPSQLGTGTGASAVHCHSLEQGSCGGYKPHSLLYPFPGLGAAPGHSRSLWSLQACASSFPKCREQAAHNTGVTTCARQEQPSRLFPQELIFSSRAPALGEEASSLPGTLGFLAWLWAHHPLAPSCPSPHRMCLVVPGDTSGRQ